jgi:hypothetical protein
LQGIANRAVVTQNVEFNITATTKADAGNSAFGQAQGKGNSSATRAFNNNNNFALDSLLFEMIANFLERTPVIFFKHFSELPAD